MIPGSYLRRKPPICRYPIITHRILISPWIKDRSVAAAAAAAAPSPYPPTISSDVRRGVGWRERPGEEEEKGASARKDCCNDGSLLRGRLDCVLVQQGLAGASLHEGFSSLRLLCQPHPKEKKVGFFFFFFFWVLEEGRGGGEEWTNVLQSGLQHWPRVFYFNLNFDHRSEEARPAKLGSHQAWIPPTAQNVSK